MTVIVLVLVFIYLSNPIQQITSTSANFALK